MQGDDIINYHNITYPDMNNGEGLRVVLWLSGCNHHCYNCQNSQTWNADSGILFDKSAKEELFRELDKDYILGLTLTGGDPLFNKNLDNVLDLINEIHHSFPNKTIWLYTGYTLNLETENIPVDDFWNEEDEQYSYFTTTPSENLSTDLKRRRIIHKCDVVVDGRYIDEQRDISLKWRGSKNQRVIDIKQSLQQNKIVLHCD